MTKKLSKEEIKDLRIQLGISQEEMAHRIGVTHSSYHRWEKHGGKPSKLAMEKMISMCPQEYKCW